MVGHVSYCDRRRRRSESNRRIEVLQTSAFAACVRVSGTGRLDISGELRHFFIDVCDNGQAGADGASSPRSPRAALEPQCRLRATIAPAAAPPRVGRRCAGLAWLGKCVGVRRRVTALQLCHFGRIGTMLRRIAPYACLGVVATLGAFGCGEPTSVAPTLGDLLPLPATTRVTGLGATLPPNERLEFDFNVTDAPGGRM